MISAFEDPAIGFVGGRALRFDPNDREIAIKADTEPERYEPRTFIRTGQLHGANMAFRRSVLEKIGGFDELLGAGTLFPAEDVAAFSDALWAGVAGACPRTLLFFTTMAETTRSSMTRSLRLTIMAAAPTMRGSSAARIQDEQQSGQCYGLSLKKL